MHDRPTASELLAIMAQTLSDTVVPATEPHARHQARVAANLCRILARELEAPSTASAIASIEHTLGLVAPDDGGSDDGGNDDRRLDAICASIASADDHQAAAVYADVAALVKSKLDVVKPGYDAHEADSVA